jgi:hypothetical protein
LHAIDYRKNYYKMMTRIFLKGMGMMVLASTSIAQAKNELPNIVYILADDPGYGDLGWR